MRTQEILDSINATEKQDEKVSITSFVKGVGQTALAATTATAAAIGVVIAAPAVAGDALAMGMIAGSALAAALIARKFNSKADEKMGAKDAAGAAAIGTAAGTAAVFVNNALLSAAIPVGGAMLATFTAIPAAAALLAYKLIKDAKNSSDDADNKTNQQDANHSVAPSI